MSSTTDNLLDDCSTRVTAGIQPKDEKCRLCNRVAKDCHVLRIEQAQKDAEEALKKMLPLEKRIANRRKKLKEGKIF